MKRTLTLILIALLATIATRAASPVEYTKADSIKVVTMLQQAKTQRQGENPVLYFANQFIGIPYVGHTLELGDTEHLIVNLHELDCTTFIETVLALALCDKDDTRTWADYCRNLTKVRYRNGRMTDYTSRLHYFTWWAKDNQQLGIVREVTGSGNPFTATQTVNINYMTTHPSAYKQLKSHPEFVPIIRKYEQATNGETYRYIPKSKLAQGPSTSLGVIKSGDIVGIITRKAGLDTTHLGIAVWQNGRLHLLNASAIYHKVVLDSNTFFDYSQKQSSQLGIRVLRFVE
ncbi:MAG: DUF1460 domain-containing protein [Bacteroidaceae bacterium]|nr:DUF1460 domain-containing protein [Bacteroidaceae bacterium]